MVQKVERIPQIKCTFCLLHKQVIRLMDLMASFMPTVKQEKQKIQHMQRSAERGRPRVRSTRGTAIGGCGRRAGLVLVHPLCVSVATATVLVLVSTMIVVRFAQLCI